MADVFAHERSPCNSESVRTAGVLETTRDLSRKR